MMHRIKKPIALATIAGLAVIVVLGSSVAAPRGGKDAGQGMRTRDRSGIGQCSPENHGKMGNPGRMGFGHGQFGQSLGLIEEQKARLQVVREEHREEMQRLMNSTLAPEEKQARRLELRQEMLGKVEAILTPEQREKAKQQFSERRGEGKRAMGGHKQRAQRCLDQLDLSPEQQQEIAAIRERTRTAVRDVRTSAELSDRAKQDRIKVIRERTHEQVMSVMTPAQRERLNQLCAQQGQKRGFGQMGPGVRAN